MSMATTTPVTSAARTATGNSSAIPVNGAQNVATGKLGLVVVCTAVSGTTPTLDLAVEWSSDGTNFGAAQAPDSFTQITAAANAAKAFDIKASFYRVVWTIGGTTPSFTFAVGATTY